MRISTIPRPRTPKPTELPGVERKMIKIPLYLKAFDGSGQLQINGFRGASPLSDCSLSF